MTRRGRGRPRHPEILTPAEQRVLNELRRGGTNAEIAARLGVTLDAVKYHISNMLGKLDLDNREQLATWHSAGRGRLFGLLAIPGTLGFHRHASRDRGGKPAARGVTPDDRALAGGAQRMQPTPHPRRVVGHAPLR